MSGQQEKNRGNTLSISAFDFYKGVALLFVVLWHTIPFYQFNELQNLYIFAGNLFGNAMMAGFFIISGIGLRKRSVKKYASQQMKLILRPYLLTAVSTCIIYLLFALLFPSGLTMLDIVKIEVKKLAGFVFALPEGGLSYLKLQNFWCGPLWFVAAMIGGTAITLTVLTYVPERKQPITMVLIALVGCFVDGYANYFPFCLGICPNVAFMIYVGYQLRQKKAFSTKMPWWVWGIVIADIIMVLALSKCVKSEFLQNVLFQMVNGVVLGIGLIYLFRWLGQKAPQAEVLFHLGKRSFYFLCVHTAELLGIPWWTIAETLHVTLLPLGWQIVIIYTARMILIILVCVLIEKWTQWKCR